MVALLAASAVTGGLFASAVSAADLTTLSEEGDAAWTRADCVTTAERYRALDQSAKLTEERIARLAFCEMAAASLLPAGTERDAAIARSAQAFDRSSPAQRNSSLLQLVAETLPKLRNNTFQRSADPRMQRAEQAFNRGDLDTALELYQAIARSDAANYEASLFAGDVYFRKKDLANASIWFERAIAADPNRETAYRYYGDALDEAGETEKARDAFVNAIIAEPYARSPWMGLQQWAERHSVQLRHPRVPRLNAPKADKNGKHSVIEINPEASPMQMEAQLIYSAARLTRETDSKLRKTEVPTGRHTLAEECLALTSVNTVLSEDPKDREEAQKLLGDLPTLVERDLLASYVLLDAADKDLAQDYSDYRRDHPDRLRAYLNGLLIESPMTR